MITLDDVKLFNLRNFIEPDGNLVPIESKHDIPFDIKRIFYVHGVKNQDDRGKHSHHKTKQVLICLNGEVKVVCDDGKNKKSYTLSKPTQALYIPEMIWDEQTYKSEDSVLLVLANTHYDINDYIEDYDEFILLKEKK
jgi:dTDP-4-dehydrorhamnose 3,5-epimerase-like enzyme|tara:strand:+ start:910 stop:1323 length:414 start_codon:yes stop_codon:yes gene_type:complete